MSVLLADFWKRLIQSGLGDSATPSRWVEAFAREHDSDPPEQTNELCQWLVKSGRLSRFQAQTLLNDEWSPQVKLRTPPVTRTSAAAPEPFSRWMPVSHDTLGPSRLLALPSERLQPVDGGRLREHAAVGHPSLAPLELVPLPKGPPSTPREAGAKSAALPSVGWLTPLPAGRGLAEHLQQNHTLAAPEVARLLAQVAEALAALHSAGLTHGHVSVDRVWLTEDGRVQLWRDPGALLSDSALGWPDGPSLGTAGNGSSEADRKSRWLIDPSIDVPLTIVPEWRGDGPAGGRPLSHDREAACLAAATPASDIFMAGALGFRLRTGRPLPSPNGPEEPSELPAELADAIQAGAQGNPVDRVLAYALAADPTQRFPTAEQLAAAATAAGKAIQRSATKSDSTTAHTKAAPAAVTPAEPSKAPAEPPPTPTAPSRTPAAPPPPASDDQEQPAAAKGTPTPPPTETPATSEPPTPPAPPAPPQSAEVVAKAKPSAPPATAPPASDPPATAPPASDPPASDAPATAPPVAAGAASTASRAAAATADRSTPDTGPTPEAPAGQSLRTRRRRRRNQTAVYILGGMCVPILLLFIALLVQEPPSPQANRRIRPPAPDVLPPVRGTRSSQPSSSPVNRAVPDPSAPDPTGGLVDSENLLWAAPEQLRSAASDGPADPSQEDTRRLIQRRRMISLLPPGAAAIASVRLAELRQLGWLDTFGAEVNPWLDELPKRVGVPLEEIERISFAFFPGSDGRPQWAMAVHLNQTKPLSELLDAWDASPARGPGGVSLFAGNEPDSPAYYALAADPSADDRSSQASGAPEAPMPTVASADDPVGAFAVGSVDQITAVAEAGGAPVLLPRLLEQLWVTVDPNDAVTLLAVPNFLVADARGWLNEFAPPLIPWVRQNLIPACSGLLIRLAAVPPSRDEGAEDGPPSTYLEFRLATAPGTDPAVLTGKVRNQLMSAPEQAEDFFVTRDVDSSWRLLASRLPAMWAFLTAQTRSGMVQRHAVFNAYLPPTALPQVTLATLLAANTPPGAADEAVASDPATKLTVAQMLDRPMSISFDQESLQFAVETIAQQFAEDLPPGNTMPEIEIIGGDLQKMGITQNQQIRDFSKRDLPLRTVLTDLLLGANPDRTATGPKDPKQALIWVLVGEGDEAEIRVTTRQAAKGQYDLPEEFVLP